MRESTDMLQADGALPRQPRGWRAPAIPPCCRRVQLNRRSRRMMCAFRRQRRIQDPTHRLGFFCKCKSRECGRCADAPRRRGSPSFGTAANSRCSDRAGVRPVRNHMRPVVARLEPMVRPSSRHQAARRRAVQSARIIAGVGRGKMIMGWRTGGVEISGTIRAPRRLHRQPHRQRPATYNARTALPRL